MNNTEKDRKFVSFIVQCLCGIVAAFLGAFLLNYISFHANGGSSLFDDIAWVLVGACVGLIGGVLLGRKLCKG